MTDSDVSQIADVLEIQRTLIRVATYTDQKRWDDHRKLFANNVTIDFGGIKPPQTIKADDLVKWSENSYRLVRTQHMVTNQDVILDGDRATATAYGRALHERTDTGEFWMIYNRYEYELRKATSGWVVSRLKMEVTWQTGKPELLDEAAEAAKAA